MRRCADEEKKEKAEMKPIPSSPHVLIAPAQESDFPDIQQIYAPYVLNTTVSLEEIPPNVEEMKSRWRHSLDKGLPYLVARINDHVVGYAYAFPYRARAAYRFTVEESVYVADGFQGNGIGRRLLEALIAICREKGYKQMIAVIGDTHNAASVKFHESLGFMCAGMLQGVGFKFGRWTDSVLMQKAL